LLTVVIVSPEGKTMMMMMKDILANSFNRNGGKFNLFNKIFKVLGP
jgi:hypothetical protein